MTEKRFEIGSEYSLKELCPSIHSDNLFNRLLGYQTIYYNTGRNAIRGVLRHIKGKMALLPAYICQSVIDAFELESYSIDFYNINTDFSIDVDDLNSKVTSNIDVLFVINYFGALQNEKDLAVIRNLCSTFSVTILEDTTHSILTKMQTIGDYCVASLRKWFALPDGGVTYSLLQEVEEAPSNNEIAFANIRTAGMILKGLYLTGLTDSNEMYHKLFTEAEKMIDEENEIFAISDFSFELLKSFDIGNAAQKRKENASYLHNTIDNPNVKPVFQNFNLDICPFFYPLYVENRDQFRSFLNQKNIYCPVHWPIGDKRLLEYDTVRYISEHLISIPIDQRYDISDMIFVSRVINE